MDVTYRFVCWGTISTRDLYAGYSSRMTYRDLLSFRVRQIPYPGARCSPCRLDRLGNVPMRHHDLKTIRKRARNKFTVRGWRHRIPFARKYQNGTSERTGLK